MSERDSYRVIAKNYSQSHENQMHSDAIAQQHGFRGALVPGVAVFGHLTHPLVERFGEQWLRSSVSDVRLFKPAYDGDELEITWQEDADGHHLRCHNARAELLAELNSSMPPQLPPAEPAARFADAGEHGERRPVEWDTVQPNQVFAAWHWQVTEERNRTHAVQISDELPIYRTRAHPHLLLSGANSALTREYVMPAWLHVGSEIRLRQLVKVTDVLRSQTVILDRWRKKDHEFARSYTTYHRHDELVTDIYHTFIFRVGG